MSCSGDAKKIGGCLAETSGLACTNGKQSSYFATGYNPADLYIRLNGYDLQAAAAMAEAEGNTHTAAIIRRKTEGADIDRSILADCDELVRRVKSYIASDGRDRREVSLRWQMVLALRRLLKLKTPDMRTGIPEVDLLTDLIAIHFHQNSDDEQKKSALWSPAAAASSVLSQITARDETRYVGLQNIPYMSFSPEAQHWITAMAGNLDAAYNYALDSGDDAVAQEILSKLNGDGISTETLCDMRRFVSDATHRLNNGYGYYPGSSPLVYDYVLKPLRDCPEKEIVPELRDALKAYDDYHELPDPRSEKILRDALADLGRTVNSIRPPMPDTFASESEAADWLSRRPEGNGDYGRWGTLQESDGGVYSTAIILDEPLDVDRVYGHAGYIFSGVLGLSGEFGGSRYIADPNNERQSRVIMLNTDMTKSRRDDWGWVASDQLWAQLEEGTPVRKTNRAGEGTKGTRKYDGLGTKFYVVFQ